MLCFGAHLLAGLRACKVERLKKPQLPGAGAVIADVCIVSALMGAGCGIREGVCAFSSEVAIGGQMNRPLAVNNDLSLTPAS